MIRIGSDSPQETKLRLLCGEAGLPEPSLNPRLCAADGALHHQPDLYWEEYQVSAQYDGSTHRELEQHHKDVERAERARKMGLLEVVITQQNMPENDNDAVEKIRDALLERGWNGA